MCLVLHFTGYTIEALYTNNRIFHVIYPAEMLSHPVLVQHLAVRKKAFEDVKLACGAIAHANVHHIQAGNRQYIYIYINTFGPNFRIICTRVFRVGKVDKC